MRTPHQRSSSTSSRRVRFIILHDSRMGRKLNPAFHSEGILLKLTIADLCKNLKRTPSRLAKRNGKIAVSNH